MVRSPVRRLITRVVGTAPAAAVMKAVVVPVGMVTTVVVVVTVVVRGRSYSSGSPVRKMAVMAAVVVVVVGWLEGSCPLGARVGVAMARREGSFFGGGWRLRMGRRKVRGGPAVVTE